MDTYPEERFDTTVCLNVVEHIEDDVGTLANIRKSLEQDGRAIVLVPNCPQLYGSLDRVLGHHPRYTREQLVTACERAGLTVEKLLKFNRIGAPGWWWNGRVLKKDTFGLWQIKLLNLLVPIVRPIDKFLPFPHLSWIAILPPSSQLASEANKEVGIRHPILSEVGSPITAGFPGSTVAIVK